MEQKIIITLPTFRIEIAGDHETELIKKAAFWQSIPDKCPKCGSSLKLNYRTPQTFEYYELQCTGSPSHSVNFGESKGTHNLYYDTKKDWKTYDPAGVDPADRGPATPVPASPPAERREPTERPPTAAERAATAESPGVIQSRNDLLGLINKCKGLKIPAGIESFEVKDLSGAQLIKEIQRINALVYAGKGQ